MTLGMPAPLMAQCDVGWSNPVHTDWPVHTLRPGVDFDEDGDGPKPSLFMFAGWLYEAGNIRVDGLAGWDGTYWHPFPGGHDIRSKVEAMAAIDEDGPGPLVPSLFIGGSFDSVGGVVAGRFARYSNGAWHGIADGVPAFPSGFITKMVVLDIDGDGPSPARLFVLGSTLREFTGTSWELVGESAPEDFKERDIIVADVDGPGPLPISLIRCGYAGSNALSSEVDRWTGAEWQRIGGSFDGNVAAMALFDPDQFGPLAPQLYAGGSFDQVESRPCRALARWRNGSWEAIEKPLLGSGIVHRLAVGDDDGMGPRRMSLFVSGSFLVPGAPSSVAYNFGRWDGQSWEGVGIPTFSQSLSTINVNPATLEIGGQRVFRWFSRMSGPEFVFDSTKWRQFHPQFSRVDVTAMHVIRDRSGDRVLVAGRELEVINNGVSKCIAAWDGRRWARIGSNELIGTVFNSIDQFDFDADGPQPPRLIVAGSLTFGSDKYAAAVLVDDIWAPLGQCKLVAPGSATSAGLARRFALFDEDGEGPLASRLYMGGTFTGLNGDPGLAYLVRWSPSDGWTSVSGQLSQPVQDLVVHDGDGMGSSRPSLYVAGPMEVNTLVVNGIAKWDGTQWSALVDVITGEVNTPNPTTTLCSFEESPGQLSLCAGGSFNTASGLKGVARWANGQWTPMGLGLSGAVTRLVVDEGGPTPTLFGISNSQLSKWTGLDWLPAISGMAPGATINARTLATLDFDGSGPMAPQLVVVGSFAAFLLENLDSIYAAGIALWGPRQPFYFATPWDRSIAAGDRLSLKVATGGPEPMTFAWTRDGVTLNDGGAVSGATTRELVIDPVVFSDGGLYECIATNACGSIPSGPTQVRVCATLANGDLNGDGLINGLDIAPFVDVWTSSLESDCTVDLTHNGVRDPDDIAWFIGRLLSW